MARVTEPAAAAAELLRGAGARVTPVRRQVLAALLAAEQPLCHSELEQQLAAESGHMPDRVTLYRVLDALVEAGLAVRSPDDRGVFRFASVQQQRRHADHAHFRCNGCGTVFCLEAPAPLPRLPRGFHAEAVELDVRGTCGTCSRHKAP